MVSLLVWFCNRYFFGVGRLKTIMIVSLTAVAFASGVWLGTQLNQQQQDKVTETNIAEILQPELAVKANTTVDEAQLLPVTSDPSQNAETPQLLQRILELEQQLSAREKMLEDIVRRFQERDPADFEGTGVKRSSTTISQEQAQAFLPEPFASLMAKQKGRAVDYLQQHQAEEVDSQWAYEVEQKVRDYFAAHENSAKLKLNSVSCKTKICEIRGYELEPDTAVPILNSMAVKSWWRAGSSYVYQGSAEEGQYFYMLADMKR